MDKFLSDLYQEEMTKKANADYRAFLATLSVSELESLAGIRKTAVAGPNDPVEPCGKAIESLNAAIKAPAKKTTPPEMPKKASLAFADAAGRVFAKMASISEPHVELRCMDKAAMVLMSMNATKGAPANLRKISAALIGKRIAAI